MMVKVKEYLRHSGSYIIDDSTLSVGDQTNDITQEVTSRGKTTTSLMI